MEWQAGYVGMSSLCLETSTFYYDDDNGWSLPLFGVDVRVDGRRCGGHAWPCASTQWSW